MPATVDIGTLITKNPEMHSGRPCLAGTGMTVLAIVGLYEQGISAEEILKDHFDHLDLARIYAALAYWAANREEIDGYFREDAEAEAEWIAEIKAESARLAAS
jgi:uncharacterized protein (DUF433 family)